MVFKQSIIGKYNIAAQNCPFATISKKKDQLPFNSSSTTCVYVKSTCKKRRTLGIAEKYLDNIQLHHFNYIGRGINTFVFVIIPAVIFGNDPTTLLDAYDIGMKSIVFENSEIAVIENNERNFIKYDRPAKKETDSFRHAIVSYLISNVYHINAKDPSRYFQNLNEQKDKIKKERQMSNPEIIKNKVETILIEKVRIHIVKTTCQSLYISLII